MSEPVSSQQRFRRSHPCPVCGGYDDLRRGKGERCYGFLSDDGEWAHCTREEYAGQVERNLDSDAFPHRLQGDCKCGHAHSPYQDGRRTMPLPPQARERADRLRQQVEEEVAGSSGREPKHPPAGNEKGYLYHAEDGTVLFAVLRYPGKSFIQCRPAVENPGSRLEDWWLGLDSTRRVLYRLPELIAADPKETVYLCEGEKDADRIAQLGLVATTNAMGAKAWRAEYEDYLKGRHVVILGDNDKDGRVGAQKKEEALRKVAASVRVHIFSDLGLGGDVSDWLGAGHTKEELLALARVSRDDAWEPIPLRDLLGRVFPPPRWVIPNVLPEGTAILAGKAKKGKTWLSIAVSLASSLAGVALGSIPAEQAGVLYLILEDAEEQFQERVQILLGQDAAPENYYYHHVAPVMDEAGVATLRAWLIEHPDIRFVVVDTLERVRPHDFGRNGNAYREDYSSVKYLADLSHEMHLCVLILHHLTKEPREEDPFDEISGTSALQAAADTLMVLRGTRTEDDAVLHIKGRRLKEDKALSLRFDRSLALWFVVGDAEEVTETKIRDQIRAHIAELGPQLPREIAELISRDSGHVRVTLHRMVKSNTLKRLEGGKYDVTPEYPGSSTACNVVTKPAFSPSGRQIPGVTEALQRRYTPENCNGFEGKPESVTGNGVCNGAVTGVVTPHFPHEDAKKDENVTPLQAVESNTEELEF